MRPHVLALLVGAALCGAAAPVVAQPAWWLSIGGQAAVETGYLGDRLDTEASALVGAGVNLFRAGPALVGLELEGNIGRVTADLGTVTDDIAVWRGRLGLRATWAPEDAEPRLVPYLRAGGVYRADRGDFIEDDSVGWYLGVGLDFRLAPRWTVGPFVTYEAVSLSVGTETWLFGIALTFSP